MIRNVKALGAAVVAVLALGAFVGAAGAQAAEAEFHCTSTTTNCIVEGSSTIGVLKAEGATIKCATEGGAQYSATIPKTGKTAAIAATYGNTTAEKGCLANGGKAVVHMNGCTYLFKSTTTTAGFEGTATADVVCPGSAKIEITAPTLPCTISVSPQTGLKHINFTNSKTEEPTTVTAKVGVTGIVTSKVGAGCPNGAGAGTASLEDTVVLKGFNDNEKVKGAQVGFHVF